MNTDTDIDYKAYVEQPWAVIGSYFEGKHLEQLVRHQIESYDDFVSFQIPKTIAMFNPVNVRSDKCFDEASGKYNLEMIISFDNFKMHRPQIHENTGAIKLMFPQ